jgi:lipopolysaccharide export system protein LptA
MLLRPLINNLLLAFTLSLSSLAHTLPTDQDEPIYVEADSANIDEAKGITRYTGSVIITQGSMVLKGETVDLLRGNDDTINQIISKGAPAYFEQRPQLDQEITYATGSTLDYTVSSQLLLITGDAKVTQGGDEFTGAKINYDMANSKVKAFSSESGSQRVKMVLQPKKDN